MMTSDSQRNNAALLIQSAWRRYKKGFFQPQFPQLPALTHEETRLYGIDPEIDGLPKHRGYFVLLGMSGLRSLKLILKMSDISPRYESGYLHIPKLYLVDCSQKVIDFWRELKSVFASATNFNMLMDLLYQHKECVEKSLHACEHCKITVSDVISFLAELQCQHAKDSVVPSYVFQFMKHVIDKMSVICQTGTVLKCLNISETIPASM